MNVGLLLGGAAVTESVFAIPGLGMYLLEAINARNYPAVQGGVLIMAFMFCFVTILTDILYAFVDPRVKAMYKGDSTKKEKGERKGRASNG